MKTYFRYFSIKLLGMIILTNLVSAFVHSTLATELDEASAAYEKRDFKTALTLWQPLAEHGNAAAQRGLGILYSNGSAVPKDNLQAVVWFTKAADQGDSEAEYRLGEIYSQGDEGVPRDHDRGLALMTKAADQGNTPSMYQLGEYYRNGLFGFPKDQTQAVSWQRKAAELGDSLAESRLGTAYQFGNGVPQDTAQASYWYNKAKDQDEQAAKAGNVSAQMSVAIGYEMGMGGYRRDLPTALSWYQKAAQKDSPLRVMAEGGVFRVQHEIEEQAIK